MLFQLELQCYRPLRFASIRLRTRLQLLKRRLRSLQPAHDAPFEVLALHNDAVPNSGIPQALLGAVLAPVVQQLLGALHGDGALPRDEGGQLEPSLHGLLFGLVDLRDEALLQCLLRGEVPRRERQVLDPGVVAYDLGQASEGANVGGDANIDFLNCEACVGGGDADISAAGYVNSQTVRDSMEDTDDGWMPS